MILSKQDTTKRYSARIHLGAINCLGDLLGPRLYPASLSNQNLGLKLKFSLCYMFYHMFCTKDWSIDQLNFLRNFQKCNLAYSRYDRGLPRAPYRPYIITMFGQFICSINLSRFFTQKPLQFFTFKDILVETTLPVGYSK